MERITKPCEQCGSAMTRKKPNGVRMGWDKWQRRRFCGTACATHGLHLTPRTIKPCAACATPTRNPKFCSKICFGHSVTQPGATPRTIDHRGRQKARRILPLTSCAQCGATRDLQRHHLDLNPRHNTHDNLAVLCRPCHTQLHKDIRRGTQTPQFLKPTYAK